MSVRALSRSGGVRSRMSAVRAQRTQRTILLVPRGRGVAEWEAADPERAPLWSTDGGSRAPARELAAATVRRELVRDPDATRVQPDRCRTHATSAGALLNGGAIGYRWSSDERPGGSP
jgi:hypothetical protein